MFVSNLWGGGWGAGEEALEGALGEGGQGAENGWEGGGRQRSIRRPRCSFLYQ